MVAYACVEFGTCPIILLAMRRKRQLLAVLTLAILLSGIPAPKHSLPALADTANAPSLVISQLKVTSSNGQFVMLYNTTSTMLDMSKYQLEYFNNYDLTKATSSKLIALSGTVPPHGYIVVNDDTLLLCYQLTVDSVSLDFSSTAGLVEVLGFSQVAVGGSVTPTLQRTMLAGPRRPPAVLKLCPRQRMPFYNDCRSTVKTIRPSTARALAPVTTARMNL